MPVCGAFALRRRSRWPFHSRRWARRTPSRWPPLKGCSAAPLLQSPREAAGFLHTCWQQSPTSRAGGGIRLPVRCIRGHGASTPKVRAPSTKPKPTAIAAVRAMQARGIQSIDVGCGQINLMHHPNAFPSLEVAFDPVANAAYAAQFLKQLFAQTGDWNKATAMYHSATPEIGAEYQQRVLAVLPEEQRLAGAAGPSPWPRRGPQRWAPPAKRDEPVSTRLYAGRADAAAGGGAGTAYDHAACCCRNDAARPWAGLLSGHADQFGIPTAATARQLKRDQVSLTS